MVTDDSELPEKADADPPEAEAKPVGTALEVQENPEPDPPPPPTAGKGPSPGLMLAGAFAAVLLLAGLVWFARAPKPAAPQAVEEPAPAATIEIPAKQPAPGAGIHDAPGPVNPSPDKIFNDAASAKEAFDVAPADESGEGFINELPPAPHAAPGANDALRDAAKNALRNQPEENPQTDYPEPEASLFTPDVGAIAAERASARRALAFAALVAKARAGAPYARELGAFLAEPQDKPIGALIADRAETGAPTAAMLAAQFPVFHRAALAAGRRAEANGAAASFGVSLATLVNLRPAGPREGAGTAAVLSRIEAAIGAGDLDRAVTEAAGLNPEAASALKPWLDEARARLALEAALVERERAILAALGPRLQ